MASTTKLILDSREDISEYVFHFTKSRHAIDILNRIITDGEIKDINQKGYICFSEAPLTMLPKMFEIFKKYADPMYAPYGIGVKKEFLYKLGGCPVFYGNNSDYLKLKSVGLDWKFVPYIPGIHDFSWLREWRVKSPCIKLDSDYMFVITNQDIERALVLSQTGDIDFDGCVDDGEFHAYALADFELTYRQISIESLTSEEFPSKKKLEAKLTEQSIGQIETHNIGKL